MAISCGFFNSNNGDRKYDATQMSAIFDGVINDGVFSNVGNAFAVKANGDLEISIDIGRAWFDSVWIYNDAILPIPLEESEILLNRYDAVVIEVDHSTTVRNADVKIIKGTPASIASRPTMKHTATLNQYPLAYIYRGKGTTKITQANITNMIGTSSCPYVTGILQVQNIDKNVAQWESEWDEWKAEMMAQQDEWTETEHDSFYAWRDSEKAAYEDWMTTIHDLVDSEVASNLASQIYVLQQELKALKAHALIDSGYVDPQLLK